MYGAALVEAPGDLPPWENAGNNGNNNGNTDGSDEKSDDASDDAESVDDDGRSFDPIGPEIPPPTCLRVPAFTCGSLTGTDTHFGLAAGVKDGGEKVFIPSAYKHFESTSLRFRPIINQLVCNGVLEKVNKNDISRAHALFKLYKNSDSCRIVYNMSPLSEFSGYDPPPFSLPCVRKVLHDSKKEKLGIKLDLYNEFYYILAHPQGRHFFGVKYGADYFRFKRLPMG